MRTTRQLQIKYFKLKHQLMPRNLPLQVEHVTLFCFNFHIMMPSDLHLLILCITCFLELPNMFLRLGLTWGILNETDLTRLRSVNLIKPTSEIGRIPNKIAVGFKGFTADQWKNWVCIYSLFALKGVIPSEHYGMWTAFVHACQLLCSKVITKEECMEADQKLMQFCLMFEALCGKEKCTPNMHLNGHLKDCILGYGPVFSFWCFSFERYNGIMGDYHTNNVNIGWY